MLHITSGFANRRQLFTGKARCWQVYLSIMYIHDCELSLALIMGRISAIIALINMFSKNVQLNCEHVASATKGMECGYLGLPGGAAALARTT